MTEKQHDPAPAAKPACPKCGQPVEVTTLVCPRCKTPLVGG